MNLTIGPRSRPTVVVRAQVWVSRVRILWRVRILVRFGRTGPESELIRVGSSDRNRLLTSDSDPICRFRRQIRNLREILSHIGLVRGDLGFPGPELRPGSAFRTGLSPVRTGLDRSGRAKMPNRAVTRPTGTPVTPDQPYMTQNFAEIPNLDSDSAYRIGIGN